MKVVDPSKGALFCVCLVQTVFLQFLFPQWRHTHTVIHTHSNLFSYSYLHTHILVVWKVFFKNLLKFFGIGQAILLRHVMQSVRLMERYKLRREIDKFVRKRVNDLTPGEFEGSKRGGIALVLQMHFYPTTQQKSINVFGRGVRLFVRSFVPSLIQSRVFNIF